jgi:hypothetical protein
MSTPSITHKYQTESTVVDFQKQYCTALESGNSQALATLQGLAQNLPTHPSFVPLDRSAILSSLTIAKEKGHTAALAVFIKNQSYSLTDDEFFSLFQKTAFSGWKSLTCDLLDHPLMNRVTKNKFYDVLKTVFERKVFLSFNSIVGHPRAKQCLPEAVRQGNLELTILILGQDYCSDLSTMPRLVGSDLPISDDTHLGIINTLEQTSTPKRIKEYFYQAISFQAVYFNCTQLNQRLSELDFDRSRGSWLPSRFYTTIVKDLIKRTDVTDQFKLNFFKRFLENHPSFRRISSAAWMEIYDQIRMEPKGKFTSFLLQVIVRKIDIQTLPSFHLKSQFLIALCELKMEEKMLAALDSEDLEHFGETALSQIYLSIARDLSPKALALFEKKLVHYDFDLFSMKAELLVTLSELKMEEKVLALLDSENLKHFNEWSLGQIYLSTALHLSPKACAHIEQKIASYKLDVPPLFSRLSVLALCERNPYSEISTLRVSSLPELEALKLYQDAIAVKSYFCAAHLYQSEHRHKIPTLRWSDGKEFKNLSYEEKLTLYFQRELIKTQREIRFKNSGMSSVSRKLSPHLLKYIKQQTAQNFLRVTGSTVASRSASDNA